MDLFVEIYSSMLVGAILSVPYFVIRGLIIIIRALVMKSSKYERVNAEIVSTASVEIERNGETYVMPFYSRENRVGSRCEMLYDGVRVYPQPRSIMNGIKFIAIGVMIVAIMIAVAWLLITLG